MVRRIRPRFTVRTLAIFVTLVCAYFGTWEATKRWEISAVPLGKSSPAPFIVVQEVEVHQPVMKSGRAMARIELDLDEFSEGRRGRYSIWLFGPTFQLFD